MTQYLITSALPYVNNVPHLGNLIGSTLSADFYTRYCRSRGRRVLFVCGSDCYGTASEVKARQAGVTPAELCDQYHAIHKNVYDWFGISFDVYGKTTTSTHTEIVKDISVDLEQQGYLFSQVVQQLYCNSCQTSLADRYVKGQCPHCGKAAKGDQCDATDCGKILHATSLLNPVCAVCGQTPEFQDSKHIFLNLRKCQPRLEEWVQEQAGEWSANAVSTTRSWFTKGLEPRCITRDLKWGTPVPRMLGKEWNKVFYVWYDAPIGYISITASERDDWREWWQNPTNTKLYQFMAKDNIPFHTVMFPALLQATARDWTLVTNICATEYLNYQGQKFSKTNGVGIFGDTVQNSGIPADYWRYYLATIRPERSDSNFDGLGFKLAIDELSDKYGNLANRVFSLIKKYRRDGRPALVDPDLLTERDIQFDQLVYSLFGEYHAVFDAVRIVAAVQLAVQVAQETNKYLYEREPWKIKENPQERDLVCSLALQATFTCSLLLSPIIPVTHQTFCEYCRISAERVHNNTIDLSKVKIGTTAPLIDKKCVQAFIDREILSTCN